MPCRLQPIRNRWSQRHTCQTNSLAFLHRQLLTEKGSETVLHNISFRSFSHDCSGLSHLSVHGVRRQDLVASWRSGVNRRPVILRTFVRPILATVLAQSALLLQLLKRSNAGLGLPQAVGRRATLKTCSAQSSQVHDMRAGLRASPTRSWRRGARIQPQPIR